MPRRMRTAPTPSSDTDPDQAHACYGRALLAQPISDLPELDVIAHTEVQKPQPGLNIPFREGSLNLYLGYKGSKSISVDDRSYTLNGGELFVTGPGIRHSTPALPMTKCAHYWLRLRLDLRRPFLGDASLNPLRADLRAVGCFHGRYAQQDLVALRAVFDLCSGPEVALRDLQVRMQLGLLLVQILRRMSAAEPERPQPALRVVDDHLRRHLGEDLGVPEMADIAGMSVSALQNLFRAEVGMPPGEYFARLKMAEAQRLLRETVLPVRQISQVLGYRSERYFSAAFRRYFLQPPGRFRSAER